MPGRSKQKKMPEDTNDAILVKLNELEAHISEIKADNKTLSSQLSDIKQDNKNIEKQLAEIKSDNRTLLLRINSLEQDKLKKDTLIDELQNKVAVLEEKADEHEQYSKRDNLLVQGLRIMEPFSRVAEPSRPDETTTKEEQWNNRDMDIMKTNVIEFARKRLKISVNVTDISTVHTLKSNSQTRNGTCIVRFTNREARDRFYKGRSELYADNQQDRIYINEHLTQRNALLYKEARELKKSGKVTHAWTKNCRVLVRHKDGTVVQIKNKDSFKQFPRVQ